MGIPERGCPRDTCAAPVLPMTAAAVKAARARSSAHRETMRYPSMVEAAEGAGVRPVHAAAGCRSKPEATAACEAARMAQLAWTAEPAGATQLTGRSEEHTSELQSP